VTAARRWLSRGGARHARLGQRCVHALLCALLWLGLSYQTGVSSAPAAAQEDAEVEVFARVVVETAALRTGPGATFRLVRVANQGETFPVRQRATRGYWLRVELPDGTLAYVQGDAVYMHEVSERSRSQRVLGKVFAPAPLLSAHAEIALSFGALGSSGFMAARPVWLLAPSFGFELNLAASVGSTGRLFMGGVGGIVNIFPNWPIVPFLAAGGGAVYASPNADSFVLEEGARSMIYAGGGLRFGFRHRIILRAEGRAYAFFNANQLFATQEISGGLSAFF
jgi:uncharacterized protein YgiM (DUF1202 family)